MCHHANGIEEDKKLLRSIRGRVGEAKIEWSGLVERHRRCERTKQSMLIMF